MSIYVVEESYPFVLPLLSIAPMFALPGFALLCFTDEPWPGLSCPVLAHTLCCVKEYCSLINEVGSVRLAGFIWWGEKWNFWREVRERGRVCALID